MRRMWAQRSIASLGIISAAGILAFFAFASRDYSIGIAPRADIGHAVETVRLYPFIKRALGGQASLAASEPVDVLIAGIPGRGNPAPNLTDTVMLARLDRQKNSAVILSLPRDLIVRIPNTPYYGRLNAVYERGEAGGVGRGIVPLQAVVAEITGLKPLRYAVVDLEFAADIVDALGGVNILVEKTIFDPLFPGRGFGYEPFELEKGWRFLDGKTATRFMRTRYGPEGDFGRMRRQQQLIEAVKQKVAGLSLIWDVKTFLAILASVNEHVRTDMTAEELIALLEFAKKLHVEDIRTMLLDADPEKGILTTGEFWFGNERASIVKPTAGIGNYDAIRTFVQKTLSAP